MCLNCFETSAARSRKKEGKKEYLETKNMNNGLQFMINIQRNGHGRTPQNGAVNVM